MDPQKFAEFKSIDSIIPKDNVLNPKIKARLAAENRAFLN